MPGNVPYVPMGTSPSIPVVLSIAGSDSGAGAGIQADIKTCAALGAYAATVVALMKWEPRIRVQQVTRQVSTQRPGRFDLIITAQRVDNGERVSLAVPLRGNL